MRKLCRALARGTQLDERALMYGVAAVGISVFRLSLLHLA